MRTRKSVLKKAAALFLAVILTAAVAVTAPVEVKAASNRTAIGLAEFGLEAYRDGWRYNYGSYGQLNSRGQRISDCSGLIFAYLCWSNSKNGPVADYSWPRGATAQYKYCYETGTGSIPRTHGILLFHRTSPNNCEHVGIYVGNDKSVDNSSYGANMRYMTASTYSKWTAWGKLKNIEYPTDGWYEFDGDPYYYVDGQYVINKTLTIDGTSYTFGSDGIPSPRPSDYDEGTGNVTEGEKMITTTGVNVRKTASLDGNIIRSIAQGTTVYVTDKSNDEWYKVKLTDGTKGYIFSQYLSEDGQPNEERDDGSTSQTGKTTTALNLRAEASTSSAIKKTLPKGTSLVITKKLDGWYKVKLSDGTTGYVSAQYVSLSGSNNNSSTLNVAAETTACVNVRKTASTNGEILKVVDSGTKVTITERTNSSWYKVKLSDGTEGYIYASYLKETSSSTGDEKEDKSCNISAKTTAKVNLRKKASTSSTILKTVKKGTKLTIIEKTNSKWYRVKLSNGTKGYMSAQYLKETKDTGSTNTSTGSKTATTTTGVNLRAEASMSSGIKCVVMSGTSVTVTDTSSREWIGVKLADGTKGYISAKYLKLNLSGKTTTAVNLRASDSTDSAIKKVVAEGTTLTITAMPSAEWFKVKLSDGTTGYIASDYIQY